MKSVIENLEAVLKHMSGLYSELLTQGEIKRDAIISGDIDILEEVLTKEYELLDKVKKAEEIRVALSSQAEDELGIAQDKKPVKLRTLINLWGKKAEGLLHAQNEIKEVVEKFRFRNRQNEELLKASITHVNDFMNLIKDRAGKNKTYNKSGHDRSGGLNILDRRA